MKITIQNEYGKNMNIYHENTYIFQEKGGYITIKTTNYAYCYGFIPLYIDNDGKYWTILVKGKNKLSFPKGSKEDGEKPLDTAIREMREETSLEYGSHYSFLPTDDTFVDFLRNGRICTQYYPVMVNEKYDNLQSEDGDEIQDVKWYSQDDIEKLTRHDICDRRKHLFFQCIHEQKQLS